MATSTSITTTYAGEAARGFISAALLSSPTIFGGGVTVHPNVKYRKIIRKLETDGLLKDASCDFNATSTLTQTERVLEPKRLQVNLQLCKTDFYDDWQAESMGYTAHDQLPPDFASYLVSHAVAKVAEEMEQNVWSGASTTSGAFDGFETLLAANAAQPTAKEIAGTTLTAANIIAQTTLAYAQVGAEVWGKEDLYIYMGTAALKFYISAQAALGYLDRFHVGETAYDFQGIPVMHCPGMSANTMVVCRKSDLHFGTGVLADYNEVKVLDMADLDGSQNVRVIMRASAGAVLGNGEDIVTYGITNASN